jgi:hypothetical protein
MMLDRLMWSSIFELFVASKYPGEKRFGIEGAESLIAGLKAMVGTCVCAMYFKISNRDTHAYFHLIRSIALLIMEFNLLS